CVHVKRGTVIAGRSPSESDRVEGRSSMGGGRKVLTVDDEPDVLLLCRVNLEFEGYEVVEASDGEEAMHKLREERPDVVLLDVMMPKMDGWQVLRAIKADEEVAATPVVMLTAKVQDQDQIRGWSEGAAD